VDRAVPARCFKQEIAMGTSRSTSDQRALTSRLSAPKKTRGIGILANEETDIIGWKPMPLFLAHVD
jgi:hypothetical protein